MSNPYQASSSPRHNYPASSLDEDKTMNDEIARGLSCARQNKQLQDVFDYSNIVDKQNQESVIDFLQSGTVVVPGSRIRYLKVSSVLQPMLWVVLRKFIEDQGVKVVEVLSLYGLSDLSGELEVDSKEFWQFFRSIGPLVQDFRLLPPRGKFFVNSTRQNGCVQLLMKTVGESFNNLRYLFFPLHEIGPARHPNGSDRILLDDIKQYFDKIRFVKLYGNEDDIEETYDPRLQPLRFGRAFEMDPHLQSITCWVPQQRNDTLCELWKQQWMSSEQPRPVQQPSGLSNQPSARKALRPSTPRQGNVFGLQSADPPSDQRRNLRSQPDPDVAQTDENSVYIDNSDTLGPSNGRKRRRGAKDSTSVKEEPSAAPAASFSSASSSSSSSSSSTSSVSTRHSASANVSSSAPTTPTFPQPYTLSLGDATSNGNNAAVPTCKNSDCWAFPYWKLTDNSTWHSFVKGDYIKIAILDSGCQKINSVFKNVRIAGKSFVPVAQSEYKHTHHTEWGIDDSPRGHGTACTYLASRVAPNASFFIGKIYPHGDLVAAIEWATECADIINLSIALDHQDDNIRNAINAAINRNKIIVCCGTNRGSTTSHAVGFPARYGNLIAVGSHDKNGKACGFASEGREIDVVAPGSDLTLPGLNGNGKWYVDSGTSYSAPLICGLVAVIMSTMIHRNGEFNTQWPSSASHFNTETIKELLEQLVTSSLVTSPHNIDIAKLAKVDLQGTYNKFRFGS